MSIPISWFIPPIFPPGYSNLCSLCLHLCFCFVSRFICTVFLDSTYMHYLFLIGRNFLQSRYGKSLLSFPSFFFSYDKTQCLIPRRQAFMRLWVDEVPTGTPLLLFQYQTLSSSKFLKETLTGPVYRFMSNCQYDMISSSHVNSSTVNMWFQRKDLILQNKATFLICEAKITILGYSEVMGL